MRLTISLFALVALLATPLLAQAPERNIDECYKVMKERADNRKASIIWLERASKDPRMTLCDLDTHILGVEERALELMHRVMKVCPRAQTDDLFPRGLKDQAQAVEIVRERVQKECKLL
jgi:hypothetical protein